MLPIKKLILLSLVGVTTGCSMFHGYPSVLKNRDKDYLQAQTAPAIKVPAGLASNTITAHYPVSDIKYPAGAEKVSLIPPGLNSTGK
jgi:uncharacterized lipoprotein